MDRKTAGALCLPHTEVSHRHPAHLHGDLVVLDAALVLFFFLPGAPWLRAHGPELRLPRQRTARHLSRDL
jgi:hypothetical protein